MQPEPIPPSAIQLRGLTRRFGDLTAVDGLSFDVRPGELFGLVGPDGAGKTTTLRMLAGVLRPSAGDALLAGVSVAADPEAVKHRLGYMSQRFGLYGDLTVQENLNFYAAIFRVRRAERAARLERLYAFSGLAPFRDRLAAKLSGGMKQKLGLSCALIHRPEILLLDEPTFGVDPVSRRELWLIVHEMVAEGVTTVVSTAYMDEAERFDRVALLHRGRVVSLDTPAALQAAVASAGRARASMEDVFIQRVEEMEGAGRTAGGGASGTAPHSPSWLARRSSASPFPTSCLHGLAGVPSTPPPAVLAQDLTRTFKDFLAVDRVSFQVAPGEVFGFLGPNGAGKTTTIKILAGLLLPSSGAARVAGFDVLTQTEAIKRNIGYMSQLFSLYGDLTVEENIDFFSGLYGVPRPRRAERKDWVLGMAGLAGHRSRLVAELSLGWKQRLALGCAVLHQPPVLFLDEPTSGVDPMSRRRFWDLIYALAKDGTTVFVTTHYMEEAEYCHRLALMNRGQLIALDTPARLRERMREPVLEVQVSGGLAAGGQVSGSQAGGGPAAVKLLRGAPGVLHAGLFGRTVHVTLAESASGGPDARERLTELLTRGGIAVDSVRDIEPSLEDVFIARIEAAGGAPS